MLFARRLPFLCAVCRTPTHPDAYQAHLENHVLLLDQRVKQLFTLIGELNEAQVTTVKDFSTSEKHLAARLTQLEATQLDTIHTLAEATSNAAHDQRKGRSPVTG